MKSAMGEEITPEIVLYGYRMGIFPMAHEDGSINWYSPDPRCVFEFDEFHVPRSLRQTIRRGRFEVRVNTAFDDVIVECGRRAEGTWISPLIRSLFCRLHRRGSAHSVESWRDGRLAGGLYGVTIGGAFFGESMFFRESDASKVALVALMGHLRRRGYVLVDTQWNTPHLAKFRPSEIRRSEYLRRLASAVEMQCTFTTDGQRVIDVEPYGPVSSR